MTRLTFDRLILAGMCGGLPRGARGYMSRHFAYEVLCEISGENFGLDCSEWKYWVSRNKQVFRNTVMKAHRTVITKWFPYWAYLDDLHDAPSYHPYSHTRRSKAMDFLEAVSERHFEDYALWEEWVMGNRNIFLDKRKCYEILKTIEIERYPYDLLYLKFAHLLEPDDPRFMLGNVGPLIRQLTGEDFGGDSMQFHLWIYRHIDQFSDQAILAQWSNTVKARIATIEAHRKA